MLGVFYLITIQGPPFGPLIVQLIVDCKAVHVWLNPKDQQTYIYFDMLIILLGGLVVELSLIAPQQIASDKTKSQNMTDSFYHEALARPCLSNGKPNPSQTILSQHIYPTPLPWLEISQIWRSSTFWSSHRLCSMGPIIQVPLWHRLAFLPIVSIHSALRVSLPEAEAIIKLLWNLKCLRSKA